MTSSNLATLPASMAGKISSSQDSDDLQSKSGMLLKIIAVMEGLVFSFAFGGGGEFVCCP